MSQIPEPGRNLHADIVQILGRPPALILDVGAQEADTTIEYLDRFPQSLVHGFEAEAANHACSERRLAPYGERAKLVAGAVSDVAGEVLLNVNSHYGTHSLLDIGEQKFWAGPAHAVGRQPVQSYRLDDLYPAPEQIDLLHMDIQGAELRALHGAEDLLSSKRINMLYLEVSFFPLYAGQPLFWDVGAFLNKAGYHLYSFYGRYYHAANPNVLSWSDALFVSDQLLALPDPG